MPRGRAQSNPLLPVAEELASRGELIDVLQRTVAEPSLQAEARANPTEFLARFGIDIPEGLKIRFGKQLRVPKFKPGPGWVPFSIRFTHCRTFVVREPGKPLRTETVCFGVEITPNRPPGPRG